jgi:regulatory protein
MIARELHARGIDPGKAGVALEDLDPEQEMDRARALARAVLRGRPPLDREQLRATVGGRLGRRGFAAGIITRVLHELAAESASLSYEGRSRFDTPLEPD